MSVADHEIDEPDPYEACDIHEIFYLRDSGCCYCRNEAADRQYDSQREERGRR